jgi:hypothetical protein
MLDREIDAHPTGTMRFIVDRTLTSRSRWRALMSVTHVQVIGPGSLNRLPALAAGASDAPLSSGLSRAAPPLGHQLRVVGLRCVVGGEHEQFDLDVGPDVVVWDEREHVTA